MKLPQCGLSVLVTRLFALIPVIVAMLFGLQEKNIGPTLVYSQDSYQWRYLFHPIDLLHIEEITHGRVHQRQMEYFPLIRGSSNSKSILNFKLIFDLF